MSRIDNSYGGDVNIAAGGAGCQYAFFPREYQPLPPGRQPTQPFSIVQCVTKAEHVDGETLVVGYRTQLLGHGWLGLPYFSRTFEFDVAGDGVGGTNVQVDISLDVTAAQVRATLLAAMQAQFASGPVRVYAYGTDQIAVRSLWHGITLGGSENVTDADFTVTNLSKYVQCASLAAGPARLHMAYDLTPGAGAYPPTFQNQEAYHALP